MKQSDLIKIKTVLISVSDKTGLIPFVKELNILGVRILSTGGTAQVLQDNNIPFTAVSNHTGFPEILNGRVKTLHPKIHGGLLALRDEPSHKKTLIEQGIDCIDMLVVNLYPFEKTIAKKDVSWEEAIENIDIGGPSMLRSAAKNHRFVSAVCDPQDYSPIIKEIKKNKGFMDSKTNLSLAQKAFQMTAQYDIAIAQFLSQGDFIAYSFKKIQDLNYGENFHQNASVYRSCDSVQELSLVNSQQIHGKTLSFNNIWDSHAALELMKEFEKITAVIVKHNTPCGVAHADTLLDAYNKARSVDPQSSFGSVVCLNRCVDVATAKEIVAHFVELVLAPSFDSESLKILSSKKNMRLIALGDFDGKRDLRDKDFKKLVGGILIQDRDIEILDETHWKVVTTETPSADQLEALLFNWKVCKHVKSNAIVYGLKDKIVGVGSGQMSRIDSIRLGAQKAMSDLKGVVVASDAFFPFADSIDHMAQFGVSAVIQPGGSIRDEEVIQACNRHKIAMVFTGRRHFKH